MPSIFISYSHEDSSLVGPVVALLRASEALVFQDADSIRPGKRWREEIGTAISAASFVVVFWCCHAKASEEVGNEITAAIAQHKGILPLLIDETPLPNHLAEFQYIDFRKAFGDGHGFGQDRPIPKPAKRRRALWWIIVGAILLVLSSTSLSRADLDIIPLLQSILVLGIALIVWTVLRLLLRRRALPVVYDESDAQNLLAWTIEKELLRRIGARAL